MRVLLCVVVAQRLFQPALPLRFTALHSPASPDERGAGVRGAGTAASRAAVRFPPQSEAAELPLGWKPAPLALLAEAECVAASGLAVNTAAATATTY